MSNYIITKPLQTQAKSMLKVAKKCKLDYNSTYFYSVFSKELREHSRVVLDERRKIVGMVLGFLSDANELFFWQIGVLKKHRGNSLATKMIDSILCQTDKDIRYIKASMNIKDGSMIKIFNKFRPIDESIEIKLRCHGATLGEDHYDEYDIKMGICTK